MRAVREGRGARRERAARQARQARAGRSAQRERRAREADRLGRNDGGRGTSGAGGTTGAAGTSGSAARRQAGGNGGNGGSIGGRGGTAGQAGGRGGSTAGAGRGGSGTAGTGSGGSGAGGSTGGAGGGATMSPGCGKTPALKNSPSATAFTYNAITSGGVSRQYILRWPDNYDKSRPYRLIIGLHGATGSGRDVARAPAYFGLFDLSQGSTIFIAPDAVDGLWSAARDTTFVSDILKQVEADLCIDLTRVELEGFSQGAAMSWTLACSLPGTFRAAVGHSGGGVANPTMCQPIAYMGSLGLQEGNGQNTQTDQFARFNGAPSRRCPERPRADTCARITWAARPESRSAGARMTAAIPRRRRMRERARHGCLRRCGPS